MLYPLLLLGMVGLAVPVILHLIQRQRLRPQVLATLQFLDPQDAANAYAPIPRDRLQLLLRLLLLALFVLLMARPFSSGGEVGPRALVVVLDQSLGSQRDVGDNVPLFDRHKQQIVDLIKDLGPDDRMALMLVGDDVTLETGFLDDKDELHRIVTVFEPSESGGRGLVPAIRRAAGLFAGRREVNACVVVFSDHRQSNYRAALDDTDSMRATRDSLADGRVKLFLIDDAPPPGPNLSIEEANFSPSAVHVGSSSRLTAVVRNHSDRQQKTQVRLLEGEQGGPPRELTLDAGETAHLDLVHRFESPVDSTCRVELDPDALPADNRFFVPMRIRDRRQVLLVTPPVEGTDDRGLEVSFRGADLLAYALNPGETLGKGGGTHVSVKRVSPQGLERVSLPLYSVIVLFGLTDLSPQSIKDLTAFVNNGGGLWIVPDGDLSPARFQATFGPLLSGFALGPLRQSDPLLTASRDESQVQHPILLPLLREEWGSLRDLQFAQTYGVQALGNARVVLRAESGDPLAVLVSSGRGQVFVQLFSTSLEGSTLPRSTVFVPFVQQVSAALSPGRADVRPDVMRIGDVKVVDVPEFRGLQGDVQAKGVSPERSFPLSGADADTVRVEGFTRAGAYELSHPAKKTSRQRWLAVNHAAGQSDLTPLAVDEQETLFGSENVERLPYVELDQHFERRHELFPWILVLVSAAFAVEAGFGAWQSRRKARITSSAQTTSPARTLEEVAS